MELELQILTPPYSGSASTELFSEIRYDSRNELPTIFVDEDQRIWPSSLSVKQSLRFELNVTRLNRIHRHLWWAGRPVPARPLHRQRMLDREIVCTQNADFHLLWSGERIFIKPLPFYLLDHQFWIEHIGDDKDLHYMASGFLLSYVWLIRHETDLVIAQECHLLPSTMTWPRWRSFVSSLAIDTDLNKTSSINERYTYGELRIRRLNQICRFVTPRSLWDVVWGYSSGYSSYGSLFAQNFAWIVILFAFGSTVLSALQVGAGVDRLQTNLRFQDLSYAVALTTLAFPFTIALLALALFVSLFGFHLVQTLIYLKKRNYFWKKWNCAESENEF